MRYAHYSCVYSGRGWLGVLPGRTAGYNHRHSLCRYVHVDDDTVSVNLLSNGGVFAAGAYISVIIAAAFISGAISSIGFVLTSIPAEVIGDEYEESTRKKLLAATVLQVVEAIHALPSGGEASAAGAASSSGLNAVRMTRIKINCQSVPCFLTLTMN
jgi:hypothetical protein